jgi:hypothetical protein
LLAEDVNAGDRFSVSARTGTVTIERRAATRSPVERGSSARAAAERNPGERIPPPKRRAS